MSNAIIGLCVLELHLPEVISLKGKRAILKSMLARLHNQFNVSASEISHLEKWQMAGIAVSTVSNSTSHTHKVMTSVLMFIEDNYPEAIIVNQEIEII